MAAELMLISLTRVQADGLREYIANYEFSYRAEDLGSGSAVTYDDLRGISGDIAPLTALIEQLDQEGESIEYSDERGHLLETIRQAIYLAGETVSDYLAPLLHDDKREALAGLVQHPTAPTEAEVLDILETYAARVVALVELYRELTS